jgi:hypothetical protein
VYKRQGKYVSDIEIFFKVVATRTGCPMILRIANHVVGLYCISRYCGYFYDCNHPAGAQYFENLAKLTEIMLAFLADYKKAKILRIRCYSIGIASAMKPFPLVKINMGRSVTHCSLQALTDLGIAVSKPSMNYAYRLISERRVSPQASGTCSGTQLSQLYPFSEHVVKDISWLRVILSTITDFREQWLPESLLAFAILHKADRNIKEAKQKFDAYFRLDCTLNYAFAWMQYAECLLENGDFVECSCFCARALAVLDLAGSEEKASYYYIFAQAQLQQELYAEALDLVVLSFKSGREDANNWAVFVEAFKEVYGDERGASEYLKAQGVVIKFPYLFGRFVAPVKSASHAFWASRLFNNVDQALPSPVAFL